MVYLVVLLAYSPTILTLSLSLALSLSQSRALHNLNERTHSHSCSCIYMYIYIYTSTYRYDVYTCLHDFVHYCVFPAPGPLPPGTQGLLKSLGKEA